jgi:release factor glutamine methyltransferase
VPYIKGFADFRGLDIIAKPGVFVPRDSSEFLAEQAIRRLRGRRRPVHLDVACGSGAIALSVKHEVRRATVVGTDLAVDAVSLARRNAAALRLSATFVRGDLFEAVPARLRGKVDVITLHPPYVAAGEVEHLPEEIRDWEPVHTLTDRSEDGLGLVTATAREAPEWLGPTGWLLVEVSPDRAGGVMRVLRGAGFRDVQRTKGGPIPVTRVVVGRPPR